MPNELFSMHTFANLLADYLTHTAKARDTTLPLEEREHNYEVASFGAGILQNDLVKAAAFIATELAYAQKSLEEARNHE